MTKTLKFLRGIGLFLFLLCTTTPRAEKITTTFTPPPSEISCPENITQLTYTKSIQRLAGILDVNDPSTNAINCIESSTMGDYKYD